MFQLLFKYPAAIFSKGNFVLLGSWPRWTLLLLVIAASAGLALLIYSRLPQAATALRNWRVGVIWLLQSSMIAVLLILLWQPAIMVAQLKPQQNIIAVVVDDSRSMGLPDNTNSASTREADAVKALQDGTLTGLEKNFQVRLYRLDSDLTRVSDLKELQTLAPSTHIGEGLKQLADETAGLPIGAVVLLSDGSDNSGGVDLDTIAALRSRHIPVHTVGFGPDHPSHDVEIDDAVVAQHALADSRLAASVSFHQYGYSGQKGTLTVRDGAKVVASHDVTFGGNGNIQTENVLFNAGSEGAKTLQFSINPLPGEENTANNSVTRLINVENTKRRILYIEGEPRWEYKFIRRAEDDDRLVQVVSMLRTTENKIYRQGISSPDELAEGFPANAENLFAYQGLIIGSVELGYFTPNQQQLIKDFVDRRGGGLLFLGGRFSLADGSWGGSNLADLLPVILPNEKVTFHREPATPELTPAGSDSIITRLVDDPAKNAEKWKQLPYMMDYQEVGTPKPGAAVLANLRAGSRPMPLLITENYGRGRTAVLATSGTWRWQMSMPVGDKSHDVFWQQLLRWLVSDSPERVVASVPSQTLFDDGHIHISADVRGKDYLPIPDAHVEAHVIGPSGTSASIEMTPTPNAPGTFQADWTAEKPGSYLTEVTASRGTDDLGRSVLTFQRIDGVAENFHTSQNRDLLERLSSQTGGQYWQPDQLTSLTNQIPYSEAGVTIRETKELWNMPAIFLLLFALKFAEWLLRRKWGIV